MSQLFWFTLNVWATTYLQVPCFKHGTPLTMVSSLKQGNTCIHGLEPKFFYVNRPHSYKFNYKEHTLLTYYVVEVTILDSLPCKAF